MSEITYAYFGGLEKSRDDKGFLVVKGLATDDTLDLDQQICDPEWLKTAMPKWFEIGNIREQHDGSKAVGKATSMAAKGTGFEIGAKIVDPVAAMKLEEGVYTGFSVGIKGAYVDMNDPRAPHGVIKGGTIVEVSVVDRPANPACSLELAKSVNGVMTKSVELQENDMTNAPEQEVGGYYLPCPACNGTGEVHTGVDQGSAMHPCEACDGSGKASSLDSENVPTLPATSNPALAGELMNDPLADGKSVDGDTEKGYNPDQPRDEHGRFGEGMGNATSAADKVNSSAHGSRLSADKMSAIAQQHQELADYHASQSGGLESPHGYAEELHSAAAEAWDTASAAKESGMSTASAVAAAQGLSEAAAKATASATKAVAPDLAKKDYSDDERDAMADKGQALPDGSFPIKTVKDLKNAIQAFGRAKDPAKAKAHIKARAESLGKEDLIPENWKGADADLVKADDMEHDPAELSAVRAGLISLIKAELDEMLAGDENEICDVQELLCSLSIFLDWWTGEASENETSAPFTGWDNDSTGDDMAYIGLGVSADLVKAVGASDATEEIKSEFKAEIRKALGVDDELTAIKTAHSEAIEQLELLKAEMDIVKNFAAPSDISLMRPDKRGETISKTAKLRLEAKQARESAKSATADAALRELYNQKADRLEAELAALENN